MAFTLQTLATIGGQPVDAPTMYTYKSSDTLAAVTGAAYFNDKRLEFEEGDLIFALLATGHAMLEVLSDTASVAPIDLAVGGFEVTVDGGAYTVTGRESRIWALDSPTITFPRANTVVFPNIPIRTLSGTTTLAAITSSIEVTSIPNGSSVVMGQRTSTDEWLQII